MLACQTNGLDRELISRIYRRRLVLGNWHGACLRDCWMLMQYGQPGLTLERDFGKIDPVLDTVQYVAQLDLSTLSSHVA